MNQKELENHIDLLIDNKTTLSEIKNKIPIGLNLEDMIKSYLDRIEEIELELEKPYQYKLSFKDDKYLLIYFIVYIIASIDNIILLIKTENPIYFWVNVLCSIFILLSFYLNNNTKKKQYYLKNMELEIELFFNYRYYRNILLLSKLK